MDQRCHGRSLGVARGSEPSTVSESAMDLSKFLHAELPGVMLDFLAGHSLGGKVVLDLLTQEQQEPPTKQVCVFSCSALCLRFTGISLW